MKKEEIYVVIDDEQKRQRAIQILTDAMEVIDWSNFELGEILKFDSVAKDWFLTTEEFKESLQETTLYQLEQLFNLKQEIKLDALKLIAESYGFELVEKKREPKAGDFGKFWDVSSNFFQYGFLTEIEGDEFVADKYHSWLNFSHITDEEKKQIQENW